MENYNIQEHEDWYRVEDNDTGKTFQDFHKWKIAIDDHLEYKPFSEEHENIEFIKILEKISNKGN